jgi:prevent-host-death family protein
MIQVNMHEAKTQLSSLVKLVEEGERVVIARDGVPVADLVRHEVRTTPREGGQLRGQIWISDDFDAPMPEIEELFGT